MMKAIIISKYGSSDVFETRELAIPKPLTGQILVEIHATALNPVDYKIRSGHLQDVFAVSFPRILGGDISGVIKELGAAVKDYRVGDEVFFSNPLNLDGGFAEYVAVDANLVAKKPKTLTHLEAATLPVAGLTTIQTLRDFSKIGLNSKVLIHAGTGSVGSFAIQYAKSQGAKVYTTVSDEKTDYAKSLGADVVINYRKEDFVKVAEAAGGMDIVFETVGGPNYLRSILATKKGGSVPSIVNPPDAETLELAQSKQIKTDFQLLRGDHDDLESISALVDAGKIKTEVAHTFSLDEVSIALDLLESGKAKGKIVLKIK